MVPQALGGDEALNVLVVAGRRGHLDDADVLRSLQAVH